MTRDVRFSEFWSRFGFGSVSVRFGVKKKFSVQFSFFLLNEAWQLDHIVRGRRTKNQLEWEKIWNKLIFSAMCPKRSPVTPLKVVKRGARCNMLICAQTCAHVIERGKISKSPKIRRFIP